MRFWMPKIDFFQRQIVDTQSGCCSASDTAITCWIVFVDAVVLAKIFGWDTFSTNPCGELWRLEHFNDSNIGHHSGAWQKMHLGLVDACDDM